MRAAGLGPATRTTDRRQQTREQVLDTALRLFAERGYLGVRVEDIAREAGVSRATFYKHFAEREQVLGELLERLMGEVAPGTAGDPSGSTEQQVGAAVVQAVRQMLDQEQLARFVYCLPVHHSALLRPGTPSSPPVFARVSALLEHGVELGDVRDDLPVSLLARHVLGAMETAMRDWAEGRVDDPLSHVQLMLDLSFGGVTTP